VSRVLLDEGVPRQLARPLRERGVNCAPFPNEWKQLANGSLLNQIERVGFTILITADKQMSFQQNLSGRRLAVLVLPNNRLKSLLSMIPEILTALVSLPPGEFTPLRPNPPAN